MSQLLVSPGVQKRVYTKLWTVSWNHGHRSGHRDGESGGSGGLAMQGNSGNSVGWYGPRHMGIEVLGNVGTTLLHVGD